MDEGLEKLGYSAFYGSAIESITLPSTLKMIEEYTFFECKSLKSIEIPEGVECVEKECFSSSGIEEIMLPSMLMEIDGLASDGCSKLKTVWADEGYTIDIRKYVD